MLHWFKFSKSNLSLFNSIRTNHFTDSWNSVFSKEHVFCSAKTNTASTKSISLFSIFWRISVCSNQESFVFVSPRHNSSEITWVYISWNSFDFSIVNFTSRTIKTHPITFMECYTIDSDNFLIFINSNFIVVTTTRNAASTHTTSNNCSVRCHTTTNCQDTLRVLHTNNIFWACFKTNKNNSLFTFVFNPIFNFFSAENNFTSTSTRRCVKTTSNFFCLFQIFLIELWVQKLIKRFWLDHKNSLFFINHTFINKIASNTKSSSCSSLTVSCLKHIKFSFLNCEFHILHIMEVFFKTHSSIQKLVVNCRVVFFKWCFNFFRSSNTSNNVFALCVH